MRVVGFLALLDFIEQASLPASSFAPFFFSIRTFWRVFYESAMFCTGTLCSDSVLWQFTVLAAIKMGAKDSRALSFFQCSVCKIAGREKLSISLMWCSAPRPCLAFWLPSASLGLLIWHKAASCSVLLPWSTGQRLGIWLYLSMLSANH